MTRGEIGVGDQRRSQNAYAGDRRQEEPIGVRRRRQKLGRALDRGAVENIGSTCSAVSAAMVAGLSVTAPTPTMMQVWRRWARPLMPGREAVSIRVLAMLEAYHETTGWHFVRACHSRALPGLYGPG
jgi:hypothetical protein